MSAVRQRILDQAEAKLRELEAEVGATIEANVDRPQSADSLPLVIMVDGDDQVDEDAESSGLDIRTLVVEVEGYVATDTAAGLRGAREDLLGQVLEKMLEDRSLAGLAIDVTPGGAAVFRNTLEGRPFSAAFSQTFVVQYATAEGDPFTLAP